MRTGTIYKATNIKNNKPYVGQTLKSNPYERIIQHSNRYAVVDTKFYRGIKKYGWDSFQWEIVQNNIPEKYLGEIEQFYIFLFDAFNNGYNSTIGGEDNPMNYQECRNKIREKAKGEGNPFYGKHHSEKTKKIIADKGTGNSNPFYGKHHTKETKLKTADANSKWYKITKPNGDVEIIKNLNKYCRDNNLSQSGMANVSIGNQSHHRKYKCEKYNHNQ